MASIDMGLKTASSLTSARATVTLVDVEGSPGGEVVVSGQWSGAYSKAVSGQGEQEGS